MTAPDPRDVLAAHAAEREFGRPKPPTPAELEALRSYAIAVSRLAANVIRLAPAVPGHEWRVRGAKAELAKLKAEAWVALQAAEVRTYGYQKTKKPAR